MSTTATVTLEGPDLEALLERVPLELGPDATIVAANKLRSGGLGGFFAKETFEVVVEVPEDRLAALATTATAAGAPEAPAAGARRAGAFDAVLGRLVHDAGSHDGPTAPVELRVEEVDDDLPFPRLVGGEEIPFEPLVPALLGRATPAAPAADEGPAPVVAVPAPVAVTGPAPAPAAVVSVGDPGIDRLRLARRSARRVVAPVAPLPEPGLDRGWLAQVGVPDTVAAVAPSLAGDPTVQLLQLMERLPQAEPLPRGAGSVIAVVGERSAALGIAEEFAVELGASPDDVLVASNRSRSRIDEERRLASVDDALERRRSWRRRRRPTVIAVDADHTRRGSGWAVALLEAIEPTMVWGVVDATRKPEDVRDWAIRVGGLDALAVQGLEETTSPAAVLGTGVPVGLVDGQEATPLRWTAILAARLLEAA